MNTLTDSPHYRASRRHTQDLLEDTRRLVFLRDGSLNTVEMSRAQLEIVEGILKRAEGRLHYTFNVFERKFVDGLRGNV